MTPNEQRLAKRIHNQRARLRQLEDFRLIPFRHWRTWVDHALRLGRENGELKSRRITNPPLSFDAAVEVIEKAAIEVLTNDHAEELTEREIKVAAHTIARIAMARLVKN